MSGSFSIKLMLLLLHGLLVAGDDAAPTGSSPAAKPQSSSTACEGFQSGGKEMPALDKLYVARLEVTMVKEHATVDLQELYDEAGHQGGLYFLMKSKRHVLVYNLTAQQAYHVEGDTCTTNDMSNSSTRFNVMYFQDGGIDGKLASIQELVKFGTEFGTKYVGKETVRGIPVEHWTTCISCGYNTTFDFYFSQSDYDTPIGQKQIPIQITVNASDGSNDLSKMHKFSNIYNFMSYRPGDHVTEVMRMHFEIPRGVICDRAAPINKTVPKLPDQFRTDIEVIHQDNKKVAIIKRYYDYTNQLSCKDFIPDPRYHASFIQLHGSDPFRIIHDYNTGVEYLVRQTDSHCDINRIPSSTDDGTQHPDHPDHIYMKHGNQLMNLDKVDFKYQGQRLVRKIPCDVWAGQRKDYPQPGDMSTVELYHAQEDWMSEGGKEGTHIQPIIGMWIRSKWKNDTAPHEYYYHIYEFNNDPSMIKAFDILACSKSEERLHLVFQLDEKYSTIVKNKEQNLVPSIRQALSEKANVTGIRMTDFSFAVTNENCVDVWFTLLPKPDKEWIVEVDSEEAYKRLKSCMNDKETKIDIHYGNYKETVEVVKGSLTRGREALDPRRHKGDCTVLQGYTSGSMGGLGFAMLLIGIIFGFVSAWCLWRRKRGIPYSVHH